MIIYIVFLVHCMIAITCRHLYINNNKLINNDNNNNILIKIISNKLVIIDNR